jgi:hypothetical protein
MLHLVFFPQEEECYPLLLDFPVNILKVRLGFGCPASLDRGIDN